MRYLTLISAVFLLGVSAKASLQPAQTNMVGNWSDSFSRAQYGNRQYVFRYSYWGFMHPTNWWLFRDHSRSGTGNWEMLTNRVQKYGYPDWGYAATNGINVWDLFYVSGNGAPNSNSIYTNFSELIESPWNAYNTNGILTNDWPFASSTTNLFQKIIIGDPPYHSFNGNPTVAQYDLGALQIAVQDALPYVDSFNSLVSAETNWIGPTGTGYPANSNLWFNPPSYDHNGNEIQLAWAATSLTNLNEETNCFTALLDWNSFILSQTNHCVVSGISQNGGSFSFTFHADRMAFGYYTPDASQTNDCTGAYTINASGWSPLMPSLTNMFCEITRITNCPVGNYQVFEDGVLVATTTDTELKAGFNWLWRVHSGAMWNQKKVFLAQMCAMVGINPTNASDIFQPNGNQLIIRYESDAGSRWATNAGMADYILRMQDDESLLVAEDGLINANLQQTNHTFQFSLVPPIFAPFHR